MNDNNSIDFKIKEAYSSDKSSLDLKKLNISILPNSLYLLDNLEVLDLDYNKITELPSDFSKLKSLKKLYLYGNPLKCFPKILLKMTHLEVLSLSSTGIYQIPKEIENMKSLKELYLNGNKISSIPIEIKKLKNLTRLELFNNQNFSIPFLNILNNTQNPEDIYNYLESLNTILQKENPEKDNSWEDIFIMKPEIFGFGVDIKALYKKIKNRK